MNKLFIFLFGLMTGITGIIVADRYAWAFARRKITYPRFDYTRYYRKPVRKYSDWDDFKEEER